MDRHAAMDWADRTDRAATMLHKGNIRFGLPLFTPDVLVANQALIELLGTIAE